MKGPNYRRAIATILIVFSVFAVLISILLRLEGNVPGSKINTLQDAMWYLMETLTTVGYGDALPVTYWGKMIGFIFLFSSFGVYGFIIDGVKQSTAQWAEQSDLDRLIEEARAQGFSTNPALDSQE